MKKTNLNSGNLALTLAALVAGAGLGLFSYAAAAADLPKATQAIMKKTGLPADVLAGLDAELQMPQKWIDGAKKEGQLIVGGTWDADQFDKLVAPFQERYPFVKFHYARATRHDRVIKPLLAFKSGRVVTDVLSGVGAKFSSFKELGAILDLSQIPNWKNVPDGMKDKDGGWIGQRLRYWCMSYNTNALKKSDLPKTWDDLLTMPKLRGGKIGMGNRPNLWLLSMWDMKGENAIREYARKLFTDVKPQLRKEGMNALISLATAGEFDVALPSAAYRVSQMIPKGAPIAWHCPEPVPMAISEMLAMKGGHENAALLFINWFMSKEGQVAQFAANNAPPVHKDLHRREFLAFPDEILGKKIAFREPEAMENDLKKLMRFWDPMWFSAKGLKLHVVTVKLDKVGTKGRDVTFSVDGKAQKAKISGGRTGIEVDGADAQRAELKPGMTCEIAYPGNNEEATKIDCKTK
ncbi:MAG: ABC transporter substrate-binding protein [Alphaproteobacteria bacterium]